MTSVQRVNHLNSLLMVASCSVAFAIPFELFLLAYAVLGPLHYLTEISWLHQRRYFAKGQWGYLLLFGAAAAIVALRHVPIPAEANLTISMTALGGVFFAALAMTFVDGPMRRWTLVAACFAGAYAVSDGSSARLLFVALLPTIIHVFVFTAAFIVLGALRESSGSGWLSVLVLAACSVAALGAPAGGHWEMPSEYVQDSYGRFMGLNVLLSRIFHDTPISGSLDLFSSPNGIQIQRFVAFAYTYHYLNWFSKTSIIQWHRIPRAWTFANIGLWLGSVAIYVWDYRLGLTVLAGLSIAHVVLEFPLNQRTFIGIASEVRSRFAGEARAPS